MSTSATTNPENCKIHEEKVSDFYIARYEVTVGLYEKVTGKNPAYVGRGDCWIFGK